MNFGKNPQNDFPKMRGGGQGPFGTFPKIRPFLKGQASLSGPCLLWSVILDYCVQGVKGDFIFANVFVIMDAGVLEFVAPQYLARDIGCPNLD